MAIYFEQASKEQLFILSNEKTSMHYEYEVAGDNFSQAGNASQDIKKKLQQLGVDIKTIKKVSIAMFEAEINMVIYAHGGKVFVDINDDAIVIVMKDLYCDEGFRTGYCRY